MPENTISLDLTNPDFADLKEKQPGETCDLKDVTVEVTGNDGETLTGTITAATLGDDYAEDDESGGESPDATPSTDDTAVAAMKMSQK